MKLPIFLIFIIQIMLSITASNAVSGCTGFTAVENDLVLVGNNEDNWYTDTIIQIYPPGEGKFGRIYFEGKYPLPWNIEYSPPAGGINDQGLFFDCFSTPELKVSFEVFKQPLFQNPMSYILEKFSTVSEAVKFIESKNLYFLGYLVNNNQVFIADKTGASAIIEGDDIIYKNGDYQVVTNFLHSRPDLGCYPCERYETAVTMLNNMSALTVECFRNILNATHSETYSWPTQYSYIGDLKNGILYVYHFFNYSKVRIFNMTEEFKLGIHSYHLSSLFEPFDNQPPSIIRIDGPNSIIEDEEKNYFVRANDPNNDRTYYLFDWGDGSSSAWIGENRYGTGHGAHTWKREGTYKIRVKIKDIYSAESEWSDPISISVTKKNIGNSNQFMTILFSLLFSFLTLLVGVVFFKKYFRNNRGK